MEQLECLKRANKSKESENNEVTGEIERTMKLIYVLES
jgi:hypothetical protein